jgi:hypothetical protein
MFSFVVSDNNNTNNILNNYPLYLLSQVNILLYCVIIYLSIIINIYVVKYVVNIKYSKFLPKNKLGKVLNYLLDRYVKI